MRFRSAPRRAPKARSRLPKLFVSAALAAATTAGAEGPATASECQAAPSLSSCIDADNLWPHASGGFFSLGSALTTPADKSAFALVASYLSRPVGLRVASSDPDGTLIYAIDNAVDATFLWALGVTDRLELSLALPVTLYQDGAGLGNVLGTDAALPRSVIRDGRFGASFAILPRPRAGSGNGLAVTGRLFFGAPFGDREAFASAGVVTLIPSVTADIRLGRLLIAADLGARIRNERKLAGATLGSQMTAAVGASFDILRDRWLTASAEAFGLYTLAPQGAAANETAAPLIPAEWIASVSSAPFLGGDLVLALGGGGSIPTGAGSALTAPRFRFNFALRYAPTGRDADADAVLDRDDKCVSKPEDRDGFEDDDGCPEPDNDNDRIPDERDRCRDEAETVDGFEDDDGCPDNDDDKDKVLDASDACRNLAEDLDKFEDNDGCPEPDNDRDGLLDAADLCPNGAEDKDGFKDEDGCPDLDNDLDQVNDDVDRCSTLAEDRDGFQDDDGCPEPDNDEDGVLDGADKCPRLAETIDGEADADGCPEPGSKSRVRFEGPRPIVEGLSRFPAGSADVSKDLEKQLVMMAQLIRGRAPLDLVIVEAFADRPGDSSEAAVALADKRATAVKAIFVAQGIPADRVTAATGDLASKRPAGAPLIEVTVTRARTEDKRR